MKTDSRKKSLLDTKSKFQQCTKCGVFLLSQSAVTMHTRHCALSQSKGQNGSSSSRKHGQGTLNEVVSVTLTSLFIPLTRISPHINGHGVKHEVPRRGRGRPPKVIHKIPRRDPGRPPKVTHEVPRRGPGRPPKTTLKISRRGPGRPPKNGGSKIISMIKPIKSMAKASIENARKWSGKRRKRVGGVTELLNNLGVKSLEAVHNGVSGPRKSSIAAKEKLQSVYQELNKEGQSHSNSNISTDERPNKRAISSDEEYEEDETYHHPINKKGKRTSAKNRMSEEVKIKRQRNLDCADALYTYKCDKCTAKFQCDKFLRGHLKVHESGKLTFPCPICGKAFGIRLHYVQHLDRHVHAEAIENTFKLWDTWPVPPTGSFNDWQNRFACKFCLMNHPTQISYSSHMKKQHPGKTNDSTFTCPYSCDVISDSILALVKHIKDKHKDKYFRPVKLRVPTEPGNSQDSNFSGRWRDPSQPDKYVYLSKCDICHKIVNAYSLSSHKEKHARDKARGKGKRFRCAVCSVGLKDRHNLRKHFVVHLQNNPFVCPFPECGQKCQDDYYLEKHIQTHSIKLVTCDICSLTYKEHLRARHKCVFDQSKIKVGDDGRKYLKRIRLDTSKTVSGVPSTDINTPPSTLAAQSSVVSTSSNNDKSRDEKTNFIKVEGTDGIRRFEMESVHFIDKIIETEDGAVHVKGEQLTPIPGERVDSYGHSSTSNLATNIAPRGSVDILKLIINDPVYQQAIKDEPEFAEMIEGIRSGQRRYKSANPLRCSNCGTCFPRFSILQQHQRKCVASKSSDKTKTSSDQEISVTRMCTYCGYQSSSESDLKHHLKTAPNHGKVGKYFCKYTRCGIPFETASALNNHIQQVHLSERKFKCDHEDCGKLFSLKERLTAHINKLHGMSAKKMKLIIESGEKFKCTKCDTDFDDYKVFIQHRRQHFKQKNVLLLSKCQLCGDELAGRHSLKRHIMLIHSKPNNAEPPNDASQNGNEDCPNATDSLDTAPTILGF